MVKRDTKVLNKAKRNTSDKEKLVEVTFRDNTKMWWKLYYKGDKAKIDKKHLEKVKKFIL